MTDKKKLYSEHITAAKDWLGKAEESIANDNDIRGDLNLMLAQAELQRAKEKDDGALVRKWLKWLLPWLTALGIAFGYIYFLRPELFNSVHDDVPAVTVTKEENVSADKIISPIEEKNEVSVKKTDNAEISADNTENISADDSDEAEKIENISSDSFEVPKSSVQTAEAEKNSLSAEDIQKMIQSAGKVLRD